MNSSQKSMETQSRSDFKITRTVPTPPKKNIMTYMSVIFFKRHADGDMFPPSRDQFDKFSCIAVPRAFS